MISRDFGKDKFCYKKTYFVIIDNFFFQDYDNNPSEISEKDLGRDTKDWG